MQTGDHRYMQMALALAGRGLGRAEPNPLVGCVIVRSGQVIGVGWHKRFGGPHAEVEAIRNCTDRGNDPSGATMYVTLEPCCHHGKTGPCTEAIIAARIARVVAATPDPSPHAGGAGFELLRKAGIDVQVGLCRQQACLLNGPFFKYVQTGQCWVIAKWAQSIDGYLAYADPDTSRWLTSDSARRHAQRLRRRVQAIMVGVNTVIADDPLLTPRPSMGRRPIRVVLDRQLRLPLTCRLLATIGRYPVLVSTTEQAMDRNRQLVKRLSDKGVQFRAGPAGDDDGLRAVLSDLAARGVQQVLVEGGPTVIRTVLSGGLADEVHVYVAAVVLGRSGAVRLRQDIARMVRLEQVKIRQVGPDAWISGLTKAGYRLCVDRLDSGP